MVVGGFGGSMGGVAGSGKAKRPIGVKFEIPYFTTSGIQVRYLKIIEPKVRPESHFAFSDTMTSFAALLTQTLSCNTPPCLGFDTSRSLATSPSDYLTFRVE